MVIHKADRHIKAQNGILAFFILVMLCLNVVADTEFKSHNQKHLNFNGKTTITLPISNQYLIFRISDFQQLTFLEIHNEESEYFFDGFYDFTYFDTVIPPHDQPLKLTIHTFLLNNLPNKVSTQISEPVTLSEQEIMGHQALKSGTTKDLKHYLQKSQSNASISDYETALNYFIRAGNNLWAGIAANHSATKHFSLNNFNQSIETYRSAKHYFIQGGHTNYRWYIENLIGLTQWKVNNIDQAQLLFEKVSETAEKLDLTTLAISGYNNLGLMHWESRKLYLAIEAYTKCLSLFGISERQLLNDKITDISRKALPTINNLALSYENLGQLEKAEQLQRYKIKASNILNEPVQVATGLINLADLLIKQNRFDEALESLKNANNHAYKLDNWWKIQLHVQQAKTYQNMSLKQLARNHYSKALAMADPDNQKTHRINTLISLFQLNPKAEQASDWLTEILSLNSGKNLLSQQAETKRILAKQATEQNNYSTAEQHLLESINTLEGKYQYTSQTQSYLQLAKLYQSKNNHVKSIDALNQALTKIPPSSDKLLLNQIFNTLAYSHWKADNKSQALNSMQKSIDQLNALSKHVSHSKTQQQLKLHVDETLTLYGMLFAKEQSPAKTVSFINTTQQTWKSDNSNDDSNKRGQERASELFDQIGNISFALENNRLSDDTRETMEREIISLNNELDYLSTINPIKAINIDVEALQESMEEDELIIQFMTSKYGSISWWISKDKIICIPLESREKLTTWVEHTRQTIADKAKLNNAIIELTEHLFSPLVDYPNVKKINLILDEPLNVLPIAALPLPETNEPMIDKYTIRSFNQLAFNLTNKTIGTEKTIKAWQAAYFANPVHHSKDTRLPTDVSSNEITEFAPLAGTAYEVKAINALIPGQVFQGFEANKNNFNNQDTKNNILHMATHAFFNEERPDLSALVLSTYDEKGKNQASMVRASEIRNMKLPYKLVVLSGCETGLSSGNGLTGLTQSFLQAGTKNLISSLWQVDDRATSMMMTLLYQNLKQGQSIQTALRNAQIHIKNQHQTRHPKYWAGWFHISQ